MPDSSSSLPPTLRPVSGILAVGMPSCAVRGVSMVVRETESSEMGWLGASISKDGKCCRIQRPGERKKKCCCLILTIFKHGWQMCSVPSMP